MRISILSIFKPVALSIALLALVGISQKVALADALLPGTTIPGPVTTLVGSPGTLLAFSVEGPFSPPSGNFTASLTTAVYLNAIGTVDFYYQLTNSGTCPDSPDCDPLARLTAFEFNGYTTDVFIRTDDFDGAGGFIVGTLGSTTADRSVSGDIVGFNFGIVGTPGLLFPGVTSFTFVVRTNATDFTDGGASAIDGGAVNFDAFQPVGPVAIPEPTSMLLLGTGLLGTAGAVRRRLKARKSS